MMKDGSILMMNKKMKALPAFLCTPALEVIDKGM